MINLRNTIEVGIEEEPYRFKYTRYTMNMINELGIDIRDISEVMYDRIINEITRYMN